MLLAEPRVDPSANGNAVLSAAVRRGHLGTVQYLLQHPRLETAAQGKRVLLDYMLGAGFRRLASVEMLPLLLADGRFDPATHDNASLLAAWNLYLEDYGLLEALLADPRVDPLAPDEGGLETLQVLAKVKPLIADLHKVDLSPSA